MQLFSADAKIYIFVILKNNSPKKHKKKLSSKAANNRLGKAVFSTPTGPKPAQILYFV